MKKSILLLATALSLFGSDFKCAPWKTPEKCEIDKKEFEARQAELTEPEKPKSLCEVIPPWKTDSHPECKNFKK